MILFLFFTQLKKVIADGLLKAAADAGQITNICLSGGQFGLYFLFSCYVMSYHIMSCCVFLPFSFYSLCLSLLRYMHMNSRSHLPFHKSLFSWNFLFAYPISSLVLLVFISTTLPSTLPMHSTLFLCQSLTSSFPLSPPHFLSFTLSFLSLTINPTAGLTAIPRIQATIKAVFPTANTLKGKFETSEVPCIGAALHGKYLAQLVSKEELLQECLVSSSQYLSPLMFLSFDILQLYFLKLWSFSTLFCS